MSTLTIALASLGGVVLAGVVAHGAWQARKAGPKRATEPPPRTEPHAMIEPVLGDLGAADGPATDAGMAASEPRPARRGVARLDALIDAIAPLALEAPVSGEMVQSHLPATRRAGSKPFLIEGLNSATGEWEAPMAGARYGEFQAGVQLANRTGALNEIEYSEFVQKTQAFADAVNAMPDFPDMLDAVARARELDGFASQHDAQLALHLQARETAWSVGYIQQQAAAQGLVPGVVPGRLVLPAAEEGAPPVLTLTFDSQAALADDPGRAAVRDLTLGFDVPQTDPKIRPFATWQASAQALALSMDAQLVDDDGQPLKPEGFAGIEQALAKLYAALDAHGLAAGSAAARRLFS